MLKSQMFPFYCENTVGNLKFHTENTFIWLLQKNVSPITNLPRLLKLCSKLKCVHSTHIFLNQKSGLGVTELYEFGLYHFHSRVSNTKNIFKMNAWSFCRSRLQPFKMHRAMQIWGLYFSAVFCPLCSFFSFETFLFLTILL